MKWKKTGKAVAHWAGCFLLYFSTTLLLGGLIGALLYLLVGSVTHPELPLGYRLSKGFLNGMFYAGVWATGLSIVLCVMRAHRERMQAAQKAV